MRSRIAVVAFVIIGALWMSALSAVAGAAAPTERNKNAGTIELACDNGETVEIWVNVVGSDRSGESPALVVTGTDGRVFKAYSFTYLGATYPLRFPAPEPPFTLVTCTHPFDGETVTLEGVFIP